MIRLAFSLCLILPAAGCREKEESTATAGNVIVLSSESIADLVGTEAKEFQRIYPAVSIQVFPVATREAFVQLLNDSVSAIAVDRPLNREERDVVSSSQLNVTENQIGSDAIVVVVHRSNALRELTLPVLGDILSGNVNRWEKVPLSRLQGPIRLVLTGRNSGIYEILSLQYAHPDHPPQPSQVAASQNDVIRAVEKDKFSVGVILFSAFDRYRKNSPEMILRPLPFRLADTTVSPTQQTIYQKLYPLSLPLYYYTNERKARTGSGFATFLKSLEGQKLIQNAGVVPVTTPSRTIQITQEYTQ